MSSSEGEICVVMWWSRSGDSRNGSVRLSLDTYVVREWKKSEAKKSKGEMEKMGKVSKKKGERKGKGGPVTTPRQINSAVSPQLTFSNFFASSPGTPYHCLTSPKCE